MRQRAAPRPPGGGDTAATTGNSPDGQRTAHNAIAKPIDDGGRDGTRASRVKESLEDTSRKQRGFDW
jgi:hypothetical protein